MLIVAIALCQLRCNDPKAQLHSLKEFTGENKRIFKEICLLAFNMTLDNKQVIDKFPVSLISLRKSPFSELFVIDPAIEDYGIEDVLSFFHLTLQEYLAARHLASLNVDYCRNNKDEYLEATYNKFKQLSMAKNSSMDCSYISKFVSTLTKCTRLKTLRIEDSSHIGNAWYWPA